MMCISPFIVRTKFGDYIEGGCGKCANCRITRCEQWRMRITHELVYNKYRGAFVTLTYDDENIPDKASLCPRDLSLYIKRVRKFSMRSFKYYAAGEYGSETYRPHYHVLFLGLSCADAIDRAIISEKWQKGIVDIGTVTGASIRYVTDYIFKKFLPFENDIDKREELLKQHYGDLVPEFQRQSQGIGSVAIPFLDVDDNLAVLFEGKRVPLPRYYYMKLGISGVKSHSVRMSKLERYKNDSKYSDKIDKMRAQALQTHYNKIALMGLRSKKL